MNQLTPEIKTFIQKMPKAEIHIHLEGAIQPETALHLARRHHMLDRLPGDNVPALRNWFTFTDFPHFEDGFNHLLHLRLAWVNGSFDDLFAVTN